MRKCEHIMMDKETFFQSNVDDIYMSKGGYHSISVSVQVTIKSGNGETGSIKS